MLDLTTMALLSKSIASVTTASVILLALLSPRSSRARLYLNSLLYVASLGVCSVWGILVSIVLSLIPGQRLNINKVVARSFYYLTASLVGFKIQVQGQHYFDSNQPAVLVGNHQTGIDVLFLGRIFPGRASIMAKQELKYAPLLGQYMQLSGAVFIDRKNRKDALKSLTQVANDMKRKRISLWIFPEGTRSNIPTPDLLPFKKGAFHLAIQAGVPIIPVVCQNYHHLFDGKSRFNGGNLKIKVLPPVQTKHLNSDNVNQLTNHVRQLMLTELQSLHHESSRQPNLSLGLVGLVSKLFGMNTNNDDEIEETKKTINEQEQEEQESVHT